MLCFEATVKIGYFYLKIIHLKRFFLNTYFIWISTNFELTLMYHCFYSYEYAYNN